MMSDSLVNANTYSLNVIGYVRSCFKEKFGVPRQSGLVPSSPAVLEFVAPYDLIESFDGLEGVSHLWLQFIFHLSLDEPWRTKVRPPRLGGNKRTGVFATRSPVRPNPIGLSVVKLDKIVKKDNGLQLLISGADLVDGTPVLDIKPYVPYADCISDARNDLAEASPHVIQVSFSEKSEAQISFYSKAHSMDIRELVEQVLQQDPRPAYHKTDVTRIYGMRLLDFDLKWRYRFEKNIDMIEVLDLVKA